MSQVLLSLLRAIIGFLMVWISLPVMANNTPPMTEKVWEGALTKEKLDAFEKGEYTVIKGNVYIVKFNGRNLKPLKRLKRVEGDFYIGNYQNPLTTVEGKIKLLNELQSTLVPGHMFSDLTEDEKRRLATHVSRSSLKGLASNKTLIPTSRKDKENFIEIYGKPSQDEFSINTKKKPKGGNPKLKSLAGLDNLEQVSGSFKVSDNAVLRDLKGALKLKSVGSLVVDHNASLKTLDGLNALQQTTSKYTGIWLSDNPKLQHINALANLSKTSDIHLYDNASLRSLDGLQKITHLSDGFFMKGAFKLTNFDGLNNLESIKGDLTLIEVSALNSFKGLERLVSVYDLKLEKVPNMKNFEGLNQLKLINGELGVIENKNLTSLKGLDNVTAINREFYVAKNPKLSQIDSLGRVANIKKLYITLPLSPKAFSNVKTLKALNFSIGSDKHAAPLAASISAKGWLPNLTQVERLTFAHDVPVNFKDALPNLKQVKMMSVYAVSVAEFYGPDSLEGAKEVSVTNNDGLQRITGFKGLKRIDELRIKRNKNMLNLSAFDALETLGTAWIEENDDMETLAGFSSLKIAKDLNIREHKALKTISGFKQLAQVNETLWLDENPVLTNASGFSSLAKVKELYIDQNSQLADLSGFQSVVFAGSLRVNGNESLKDLSGLKKLKQAAFVRVERNQNLKNLKGLEALEEVVGLTVSYNDHLTSLNGLENLTKVRGGQVVFKENDELVALGGLRNLTTLEKGEIFFRKNGKLNNYDGLPMAFLNAIQDKQFIVDGNADNVSLEELKFSRTLNSVKLNAAQLQNKPLQELSLLRNELFARKGYNRFTDELLTHFNKKGWYQPVQGEYKATLTDLEEHNIKLIVGAEKVIKNKIKNTVLTMRKEYKKGIKYLGEFQYLEKTLQSFVKHININALLKSKSLNYSDAYFVQEDGCEDTVNIEFNEGSEHFSIYVEHCAVTPPAKACHLRVKNSKQGQYETDFIGNGCQINIEGGESNTTTTRPTLVYKRFDDGSFELVSSYDEYAEEGY